MRDYFSEDIKEKVISATPVIDEYKRFEEFTKIFIKRKPLDSSMGMNFYALNY